MLISIQLFQHCENFKLYENSQLCVNFINTILRSYCIFEPEFILKIYSYNLRSLGQPCFPLPDPFSPYPTLFLLYGSVGRKIIMPPTLKKWGAYCFLLVRVCVCVCAHVRPSVQFFFKARDLKCHIWIPGQK